VLILNKKILKKRWNFLFNPKDGFKEFLKLSFEESLYEYLLLILFVGLLSAIFIFILNISKAIYINFIYNVDIHFLNMINYTLGKASGIIFFYFFAGTFLLFILSMIIHRFFKDIRYVRLLQIFFISLTPVLIFGWIPWLSYTLLVWSLFLFIEGIKFEKQHKKIKNTSIDNRD